MSDRRNISAKDVRFDAPQYDGHVQQSAFEPTPPALERESRNEARLAEVDGEADQLLIIPLLLAGLENEQCNQARVGLLARRIALRIPGGHRGPHPADPEAGAGRLRPGLLELLAHGLSDPKRRPTEQPLNEADAAVSVLHAAALVRPV